MKRELNKILDDLIIELEKMVTMLRRDTSASWTRGFEGFLAEALDLKSRISWGWCPGVVWLCAFCLRWDGFF